MPKTALGRNPGQRAISGQRSAVSFLTLTVWQKVPKLPLSDPKADG
jgi:hypothetical protein